MSEPLAREFHRAYPTLAQFVESKLRADNRPGLQRPHWPRPMAAVRSVQAAELTLSERRRLEVARALAMEPELILLDLTMPRLEHPVWRCCHMRTGRPGSAVTRTSSIRR